MAASFAASTIYVFADNTTDILSAAQAASNGFCLSERVGNGDDGMVFPPAWVVGLGLGGRGWDEGWWGGAVERMFVQTDFCLLHSPWNRWLRDVAAEVLAAAISRFTAQLGDRI